MNVEIKKNNNSWTMYLGPAAAVVMWILLAAGGLNKSACWEAVITTWCAVWWIFEPTPIPATSILTVRLEDSFWYSMAFTAAHRSRSDYC